MLILYSYIYKARCAYVCIGGCGWRTSLTGWAEQLVIVILHAHHETEYT